MAAQGTGLPALGKAQCCKTGHGVWTGLLAFTNIPWHKISWYTQRLARHFGVSLSSVLRRKPKADAMVGFGRAAHGRLALVAAVVM